jgi:hypothetical protein
MNSDAATHQALRFANAQQQMPTDRCDRLRIAKVRTAVEVPELCLEPVQYI